MADDQARAARGEIPQDRSDVLVAAVLGDHGLDTCLLGDSVDGIRRLLVPALVGAAEPGVTTAIWSTVTPAPGEAAGVASWAAIGPARAVCASSATAAISPTRTRW